MTGAGLAAGSRLSDLPPGYALVISRVRVTFGGEPIVCSTVQTRAPCGLTVRYQTGETFLVPHQSYSGAVSILTAGDPFFALRLPQGTYEVLRFEAPPEALREGSPAPPEPAIALRKRFSVKAGEFAYVGSLLVDVGSGPRPLVAVRILNEAEEAARVAAQIDPIASPRLTVRLME
jgi:hypothetical protein